jgi:acetoin utilization protein AcuB
VKQIPPIKAVMTAFPYYIEGDQPVAKARAMMAEHGIRHLPVVKDGKLVSVVTDRDIRLALRKGENPDDVGDLFVRDVPGRDAYIVELTEPLDVVVLHMSRHRTDAALVVKSERLVGIFTMTDACHFLGGLLRALFPREHGDDAA